MADRNLKTPTNVPGAYYVDETCIDCDQCRHAAPAVFRRDDQLGVTIAYRQPTTAEETAMAEAARQDCPTESIGNDGRE